MWVLPAAALVCLSSTAAQGLRYAVSGWDSGLVRLRRQVAEDAGPAAPTIPPESGFTGQDLHVGPDFNTDLSKPLNKTEEFKSHHYPIHEVNTTYYTIRHHNPSPHLLQHYWRNITALIAAHPKTSASGHPQLISSYRRAVSLILSFPFPFYGHRLRNLTIATGGFAYVGDQMHSWLAATQYVAPLMANFDTTPDGASIQYADTGDTFIVEWRNVVLRNEPTKGNFTFQLLLHHNGSIWFLYKSVPLPVKEISDSHHPRKVGLSDAYLYEHRLPLQTPVGKRVIYEYHRVEIDEDFVSSNAVIEVIPLPTCIAIENCKDCMNASLSHFNCSWCDSKESGPAFCSDQHGLHRRRQDWTKGQCRTQSSSAYCTNPESETSSPAPSQAASVTSAPASVPSPTRAAGSGREAAGGSGEIAATTKRAGSHAGGGGLLLLLLLGVLVVVVGGWIAYAYLNPHTPSGQFLIKYRPGRWRLPGNHGDVRYTASVHM